MSHLLVVTNGVVPGQAVVAGRALERTAAAVPHRLAPPGRRTALLVVVVRTAAEGIAHGRAATVPEHGAVVAHEAGRAPRRRVRAGVVLGGGGVVLRRRVSVLGRR